MKLKKCLAFLLSAVLMLSFLPLFASASGVPTVLKVGEKDKSEHDLITRYKNEGIVRVYSINDSKDYYEVTYEKDVGYVLTFYNSYTASEPIRSNNIAYTCGVYCDGDLTIRVAGNVTLDMDRIYNDKKQAGANGIYVRGVLTIEGLTSGATLTVYGDKHADDTDTDAVGIRADSLLLHKVRVNAAGSYAAVCVKDSVAMINADLYANAGADMRDAKGEPRFAYSVIANDFIQANGYAYIAGDVNIESYDLLAGDRYFEKKIVTYTREYKFKGEKSVQKAYSGLWRSSFDLFVNASLIPSCIHLEKGSAGHVVSVSGNKASLAAKGSTKLSLVLVCGQGSYVVDTYEVACSVAWWQWIPYILSGAWLNK